MSKYQPVLRACLRVPKAVAFQTILAFKIFFLTLFRAFCVNEISKELNFDVIIKFQRSFQEVIMYGKIL